MLSLFAVIFLLSYLLPLQRPHLFKSLEEETGCCAHLSPLLYLSLALSHINISSALVAQSLLPQCVLGEFNCRSLSAVAIRLSDCPAAAAVAAAASAPATLIGPTIKRAREEGEYREHTVLSLKMCVCAHIAQKQQQLDKSRARGGSLSEGRSLADVLMVSDCFCCRSRMTRQFQLCGFSFSAVCVFACFLLVVVVVVVVVIAANLPTHTPN